jgi:hypothetical protein
LCSLVNKTIKPRNTARQGVSERSTFKVLVVKPEGKRKLRRPSRRREKLIKRNLNELEWGILIGLISFRGRDQW